MSAPILQLNAPHDITETSAVLSATVLDTGGNTLECWNRYRRSGKPHWIYGPLHVVDSAPTTFEDTITTKYPLLQHECSAQATSFFGDYVTETMRFWFIPYQPRSKGAPFLVQRHSFTSSYYTITLECDTDIPCHLQVHISTIAPYSTAQVETKRGRRFKHHPVLIWQWRWHVWQEESKDTTHHTFVWDAPFDDTTYWFQCLGLTDGRTSPSRSPYFSYHLPKIVGVTYRIYFSPGYMWLSNHSSWEGAHNASSAPLSSSLPGIEPGFAGYSDHFLIQRGSYCCILPGLPTGKHYGQATLSIYYFAIPMWNGGLKWAGNTKEILAYPSISLPYTPDTYGQLLSGGVPLASLDCTYQFLPGKRVNIPVSHQDVSKFEGISALIIGELYGNDLKGIPNHEGYTFGTDTNCNQLPPYWPWLDIIVY